MVCHHGLGLELPLAEVRARDSYPGLSLVAPALSYICDS